MDQRPLEFTLGEKESGVETDLEVDHAGYIADEVEYDTARGIDNSLIVMIGSLRRFAAGPRSGREGPFHVQGPIPRAAPSQGCVCFPHAGTRLLPLVRNLPC